MFRNHRLQSLTQLGDKKKTKDPDYEEIGPQRNNKEVYFCELCGSVEAEVKCDKCNGQSFCFSCDDMYHKHPKRATHNRQPLECKMKGAKSGDRPPLPPKGNEGHLPSPPQPPPRKNKRPSFLPSGSSGKKEQPQNDTSKSLMGSLRRIMGNRPLPPTPDQEKDTDDVNTYVSGLTRSKTAPSPLNSQASLTVALPESIIELNRKSATKSTSSMPPTPISSHAQYPKLQPKLQPQRNRKFSLQQFPSSADDKRASMVDDSQNSWEKQPQMLQTMGPKGRSQSISNDQWNQVIAMQGPHVSSGRGGFNMNNSSTDITSITPSKQSLSTMSNVGRGAAPTRGMVSSASVCDLNTIAQQHHHQVPYPPNMPTANSFQQLSLMGYDNQMMWMPPCAMCQPPPMYPASISSGGMKRTTSNISMNMSSVGSDVTGYPWAHNPHMHHHMPMYPPGFYPQGGCHQQMAPSFSMRGSAMSIPDTMRSYNRVPSSPAPSTKSMSHRSHKSSKSRSSDVGSLGRKSRNQSRRQSEDSDESRSSSFSDRDEPVQVTSAKSIRTGLAWQCDHCTFINPGHVRTCGMCSKHPGIGDRSSRRSNERRKNGRHRKTDIDDNAGSDYDNDKRNGRESRNDSRIKSSGSLKSSKSRNKSRRRNSFSRSPSISGSNEDEGAKIERQLKDLRITSRSRDYEGISRSKDVASLKREGGGSRYRNRRRFNSERSRTPARSTRSSPARRSRRTSINSDEKISFLKRSSSSSSEHFNLEQKSSLEGTLVGTNISDSKTVKSIHHSKEKNEEDSESLELSSNSEADVQDEPVVEVQGELQNEDEVSLRLFEEMKSEKIENLAVIQKECDHIERLKSPYQDKNISTVEEPSFANTLDGIETLKTNELADGEPNSQVIDDRPSSADIPIHELDDIPVLKYIEPEKSHSLTKSKDKSCEKDKYSTIKKRKNPLLSTDKLRYIESDYETVEKPYHKKSPEKNIPIQTKSIAAADEVDDEDIYQPISFKREERTELVAEPEPKETNHLDHNDSLSSASSHSSGRHSGHRMASYSSSDALFYSPPDSPELSEKLRIKSTQITKREFIEDDLVTALETIDASRDDLKSSRDTIRSSFDQLPSSDEVFEYDEAIIKERPSSVAEATSPLAGEEGTAGYDTLSFQDAVSHPETPNLKRSLSEKILSPRIQPHQDKLKEPQLNVGLKETKKNEKSSLKNEQEEDERLLSVKEIIARRKQKAMKKQGLELVQILRDAEELGFNPEDVSVALSLSTDKGPLEWLQENWSHMIDTVTTLASNYGRERKTNDVGEITAAEAKQALRLHKGNIWDAVTECVETRQKKFKEIYSKRSYKREDIIKALQTHEGDLEEAYMELAKTQPSSSFFKKIWAPAEGAMNSVSSLFRRDSQTKIPESIVPSEPPTIVAKAQLSEDRMFSKSHENLHEDLPNTIALRNDREGELYANVVTPLLKKIELSLLQSSDLSDPPVISEELKRKIVHAILDADPNSLTDNLDSDDESTIEELLAVAENPTFYEYFTAVDLEEDYETNVSDTHDEETDNQSSDNESPGTISETETEDPIQEVPSDFEYKDGVNAVSDYHSEGSESPPPESVESVDDLGEASDKYEEPVLDILEPDVENNTEEGVIPFNDPSTSTHTYESVRVKSSFSGSLKDATDKDDNEKQKSDRKDFGKSTSSKKNQKNKRSKVTPKSAVENIPSDSNNRLESDKKGNRHKENIEDTIVHPAEVRNVTKATRNDNKQEEFSNSDDQQESTLEESEEESVSVTTGRMSLSVTQTGNKKAKLDVKSQTIITDKVHLNEASTAHIDSEEFSEEDSEPLQEREIHHEIRRNDPEITSVDHLPPEEAAKVRATGGPVTVQKASAIVGKAIANAMKRESTVKRENYKDESLSPVISPTPPASPMSEDLPEVPSIVTSDSEDDLLGSLDTIPEEEEISDRTNSGRVISKSAKTESRIGNEQVKSLPPAVASYSGPIFIPSTNEKSESSSHSYYNVSKENISKNATPPAASCSSDYESLTKTVKITPKDDTLKKQEAKKLRNSKEELEPKMDKNNSKLSDVHEPVKTELLEASGSTESTVKTKLPNRLPIQKKVTSNTSIKEDTTQSESSKLPIINQNLTKTKLKESTVQPNLSIVKSSVVPSEKVSPSSSAVSIPIKLKLGERSTMDSSGESEEEGKIPAVVHLVRGLPQFSLLPDFALKVETLKKSDDPDYQDVQELKEQIQIMRRELEAQIDDKDFESDATTTTTGRSTPQEEFGGPLVILSAPADEEKPVEKVDQKQYEQLKFDRTVRRLLAEGQATSYEKAELAAQLLTFSFDESDSIQAAEGCSSIYTALQFLQQECELCATKYPMGKMISMLHCVHRCCYDCANNYFSFQIKTKNIRELRCPFCNEPDLDNSEEIAAEYLNNLDILLKNIIDQDTHELFQRKLRDWTLMKDPNFKWCNKCSSGFIANHRARKLICPDCKDVTCAGCRKQWELQHEGITCEDFSKWQEANDPQNQAEGVAKHLAENGITCPKCKFTYSLAKGGCMHFTCGECKYEFCSGCNQPFKQGAKCIVGPYCERLGLHAHHPRNCLFYLRDKEPGQLQQLLKDYNIPFEVERPTDDSTSSRNICKVMEQKETLEGLVDDVCGRVALAGHAGYCRTHYIEYLVEIINLRSLDPVGIFDEADLRVCLRRNGKSVPVRRWESEKLYRDKLIKLIKEQLPLQSAQQKV